MGFASGSVTFRRFRVVGTNEAKAPSQGLLDNLAENIIKGNEFGIPEEVDYGWSGGQHVLDNAFTFEANVFGSSVHFAMRIDVNKVPSELVRAWTIEDEKAVASLNPSGFISKLQKKDVKDGVRLKKEEALRSRQYLKSRIYPVLWDMSAGVVYSNVSGGNLEKLCELFERTMGLQLEPMSAGTMALQLMESRGKRREYEDLRPTRFAMGPEGESVHPEYPWIAKGPEPKDFLGNEFLLWLWHEADARTGVVSAGDAGQITLYFDRSLDLDCGYGQTGRDALRGDGPSRMPEAKDALRSGKLPRKAGLILDVGRLQYSLTIGAEKLALGGVKLPEVEEAESPRDLFEERLALISGLCAGIDGLFATFLAVRASGMWEHVVSQIRSWINASKAAA